MKMEGLREMELYEVGTGTATSDYYMVLTHAGGRITGRLEYNAELFKHTTAQRMASDWQVGPSTAALLPPLGGLDSFWSLSADSHSAIAHATLRACRVTATTGASHTLVDLVWHGLDDSCTIHCKRWRGTDRLRELSCNVQ